jgi:hypothetical protein
MKINFYILEQKLKNCMNNKVYYINKKVLKNFSNIQNQLDDLDKQIYKLRKQFPECSCCGSRQDPKMMIMIIATEEDSDNWVDSNEGYAGPTVGGYYCGC